jgi:hypothetical protein
VLAEWRERDEHDADDGGDRGHERGDMAHERGDTAHERGDTAHEREEILQPVIPARSKSSATVTSAAPANASTSSGRREPKTTRSLAVGAVDGLDAEAAAALARAGVRDLRALAMCDTLAVARASGLSWSRLNRLRALAARVPGVVERVGEDEDVEEKISPSERPMVEHERLRQLEPALPSTPSTTQAPTSRPSTAPVPHAVPSATTAPRYSRNASEGAGGPFA